MLRVLPMFNFDAFEDGAGHDLTMVQGLLAGVSTYACEHCGALVQVGGPENKLVLFHVPPGSRSTERQCVRLDGAPGGGPNRRDGPPATRTLKDKLRKLQDESMDRLRRAAEED